MGREACGAQPLPPKRSRALTGLVLATSLITAPAIAQEKAMTESCKNALNRANAIAAEYNRQFSECRKNRSEERCAQDLIGLGLSYKTEVYSAQVLCEQQQQVRTTKTGYSKRQ